MARELFCSFFSFNLSNTSPVNLDYKVEVIEDIGHPLSSEHPPVRTSSRSSVIVQVCSAGVNIIQACSQEKTKEMKAWVA